MNKPTLNARIDSNALRLAVAAALAVTLAGCAVTPNPMSGNEIAARVASDKSKMYADQDPITGPVSLAEASARSIKYNLDHRLKMMEQTLAQGQLDVSRWDMFPRLLANAGYVHRSNELAYVIPPSNTASTTTLDRSRRLAAWNFRGMYWTLVRRTSAPRWPPTRSWSPKNVSARPCKTSSKMCAPRTGEHWARNG